MGAFGGNNLNQLDRLVLEAVQAGAKQYRPVYERVFNIETPMRKDEKFTIVKMDNAAMEVADGAAYPESSILELGANTISQKIFKSAVPISDFSEEFDNYGAIAEAASQKIYQFNFAIDQLCAAFFNNATSATAPFGITIGTTVTPLLSTTQPIGDTGFTQSNLITGNLDKSTLNSAFIALMNQMRHDNTLGGYQQNRLVVPTAEYQNAWQITASPDEPESANRNRNFTNTLGLEIVVWPLITHASSGSIPTAWWLMAPKGNNGARGPKLMVKYMPRVRRILSQATGNQVYQIGMMLNPGLTDYLGVVGGGY